MEIKKGHVIAALLLLTALAGAGAVYQFYVKERLAELSTHLTEEKNLEDKIAQLEETFYGTKPDTVLNAWRTQTQPWLDAVEARAKFFNMADVLKQHEVPENTLAPKFYYTEEHPKMMERLTQLAQKNRTTLATFDFGVQSPDSLSGADPTRQDVSDWLTRLDYAISMADIFIQANAITIDALNVWPPRDGPGGTRGKVQYRTTGVKMTIAPEDLEKFLEKLSLQERYFSVDGIWISNTTLRNPRALLNVQMLLTQARFIEGAGGGGGATADGSIPAIGGSGDFFASFMSNRKSTAEAAPQRTWWQNFRKKWLPF